MYIFLYFVKFYLGLQNYTKTLLYFYFIFFSFYFIPMPLRQNFKNAPTRKKRRTGIITVLILALILAYFFGDFSKRTKNIILGTGIGMTAVLGLDVVSYEIDFKTLRDTGSIDASRKTYSNGVALLWDCSTGEDLDCDNFSTQDEAQSVYEKCMNKILEYNKDVDKAAAVSLDVYGLDGDKDGTVCEHLPAVAG